jgi:hypothetical protein
LRRVPVASDRACAGRRSAIFERQRHHIPLPFGREELDVDVDDLVHLGPRIVPPLRRQRRPRLPPRDLLALPVIQETTVDTHLCKIGRNRAGLESGFAGRLRFSLENDDGEAGGHHTGGESNRNGARHSPEFAPRGRPIQKRRLRSMEALPIRTWGGATGGERFAAAPPRCTHSTGRFFSLGPEVTWLDLKRRRRNPSLAEIAFR